MQIDIVKGGGDASEFTLQQIKTLLEQQKEFSESIWVDATQTYYIRRRVYDEGTDTWTIINELPDGTSYSPTAPSEPASAGADREVTQQEYVATANGTGFSDGDSILRVVVIDTFTATIEATIWYNVSTGSVISAPSPADITPTPGLEATILDSIGLQADAAYTTGSGTLISILKGVFGRVLFTRNTGASDATTLRTVSSSDSPDVVSIGAVGDAAWTSGNGTVISVLKGIYTAITGLFAYGAGSVNATTIRTTQASDSPLVSATGSTADAAYTTGSGSIISILKGIFGYSATAATESTLSNIEAEIGDVITGIGLTNETAPGTDTATSGLNGRLQRIAQRITSLIALWITPGTAIGSSPVSPSGASDGTNWVRLRSDSNGRLELSPSIVAPSATQSTTNFYVNAAVTVDQNSATSATTPSGGASWISATNNSGVVVDITVGGTSGGADGTTILTLIAGDSVSMPIKIAASAVIRVKPRLAGLTTNDFVAVRLV